MELKGGQLKLLSQDQIRDIYISALDILEDVGVRIKEQNALKTLDEAGATVDYDKQQVWLPAGLVEEAVSRAPSRFTWYARNPKNNMRMEDGKVHYSPGGTFTVVIDLETGERRPTTLRDVENFTKVIDALPYVHEGTGMVTPTDLPRQDFTAFYHMYLAMHKNTSKPVRGVGVGTGGGRMAEGYVKMASVMAGGSEELRKKPLLMSAINPVSPLMYTKEGAEAVITYAKHHVPMFFSPEVQAGATGPVTLAGVLVQNTAEALAGITLAETVSPGTPVMFGTVSTIIDQRVGEIVLGSIETGILGAASVQMACYLGIPSRASAGATDSKILDAQAGYECALNILLTAAAGANMIQYSVGTLEFTKTGSYELLIIGNEILGMVSRVLQGIEVNDETLALDIIRKVGPGGHYLSQKHTLEHLKKEQYFPTVTDRRSYQAWKATGAKQIGMVAREEVKRILKEHQPEPLDKDVVNELEKIIEELERQYT